MNDYEDLSAEIARLRAELAQAQACCAEMRELITVFRQQIMPGSDLPTKYHVWIHDALSSTCGTALLEELRELRGLLAAIDEDTNGGDPFLQELLKLRIEVKELRSFKAKHEV